MLNLSNERVLDNVHSLGLQSVKRIALPTGQHMFRRWVLGILLFLALLMFLPWVQNFRAKGRVTALDPASRPQTIHSTIPGRIEQWYVFEGDSVSVGDTIARLSETKPEYLDPNLVDRSQATLNAKLSGAEGYLAKADALAQQASNLRQEQELKVEQSRNKVAQSRLYVETLEAQLARQRTEVDVAQYQFERADSLYRRGLKPLTDQEAKRLKVQEAQAKLTELTNKLDQARTDVEQAELALRNVLPEYSGKLAKIESERQSALTDYYTATGEVAKLENQVQNYRLRSGFTFIVAPQGGTIAKVLTPGLGETVKEGEAIVSILPQTFKPAVEIYVEPFNLPLIKKGQEVRFLFDGWPAVIFSGWPGLSYGTFMGEVVAIDNIIDAKGNYRVLVAPSDDGRPWPEALRPGSGAEGVALLNRVRVWYELWRQLNAFPPDYYIDERYQDEKEEGLKLKAPAKTLAK